MKNSASYQKKMKKIFSRARKQAPRDTTDTVRLMLMGILEEDVPARRASKAMELLEEEFVDFNELRVSPVKDIAERLGADFPGAHAKAMAMIMALGALYQRMNSLSLDYLSPKPKREIRKLLREECGLSPYAESVVTLYGFDGHAIPVDSLLLEALKLDGHIDPGSDLDDLQGFLERIILNKDAVRCHEALRGYAAKSAARVGRELTRRRKQAEAEAKAKAEAEAKARAEAEAKAKEKAKAEAKAKAAKARKAAARKATKKKQRPKTKTKAKTKAKAKAKAKTKSKAAPKRTKKPATRRKTTRKR